MEHLEMAGAPARTPGTDSLTINDLPDDMIINILSMIDIESLLVVAKVCTRWQQLCKTPYIWEYARLYVDEKNYKGIIKNILPIVGKHIKNVKTYYIFDEFRASLITHCPNLTYLELETWEVYISILDDLHHWPNLKFLNLYIKDIIKPDRYSGYHLPFVANNLKTLKISYNCSPLAAKFRASLIRSCSNLTYLKIYESKVDSSIFDDLHLLPNLKFLSFDGTKIVQDRNSAYNLLFEKLKYLETLILLDISLTPNSLYSMLKCENLVRINIEKMRNIPADFLESLVRIKQSTLKALFIYGDTLNDDIMRHICNCRLLQVLSIMTCETLSDSSLQHLSRLKKLETLELFSLASSCKFSSSAMVAYLTKNTFQQMKCLRVPRCFPLTAQVIDIINTNAPNLETFYHDDFLFDKQHVLNKTENCPILRHWNHVYMSSRPALFNIK